MNDKQRLDLILEIPMPVRRDAIRTMVNPYIRRREGLYRFRIFYNEDTYEYRIDPTPVCMDIKNEADNAERHELFVCSINFIEPDRVLKYDGSSEELFRMKAADHIISNKDVQFWLYLPWDMASQKRYGDLSRGGVV